MARHIIWIAALLLVAGTARPAAAAIDEAGRARLQAIVTDMVAQWKSAAESNGSVLETEGGIMVEEAKGYYAVTMPHMALRGKGNAYTEIGMIAANALPGDRPDEWKITLALPTPIIAYDDKGVPAVTVQIGGQNFAGIWQESFKNFSKLNARYKDVSVTHRETGTKIAVPALDIVYDLHRNEKNLWSGPVEIRFSGAKMNSGESGAAASLGELAIVSNIEDYAPESDMQYKDMIHALAESYESGDNPSLSGEHVLGLYNMITGMVGAASNGFDCLVTLKDLSLTRPPIPGSGPGKLAIANAKAGFGMSGLRTGLAALDIKTAYDGFTLAPADEKTAAAVPDHMTLNLRIGNIPYKESVDLGRETVQTAVANPQAAQMALLNLAATLPALLTKAQTHLKLEDTTIGNDKYGMAAQALFTADMKAQNGMTGTAKAEIAGIDSLMTALSAAAENPAAAPDEQDRIRSALAALAVAKMIGQIGRDEQGRETRTYNLEMDAQGRTLLNGTDLQMLMQTIKAAP